MPNIDLHIGPFASAYVGLASGDSVDVLTQLTGLTTSSQKVTINQPEAFSFYNLNTLQSGPQVISVALTFLSDDPQAVRLTMGNFFDAPTEDTPNQQKKLMLLLIHPDETAESSFLIPTCIAQKGLTTNWEKNAPTVVPVTFFWQAINRFNPQFFYKRSVADLDTILGIRSPF